VGAGAFAEAVAAAGTAGAVVAEARGASTAVPREEGFGSGTGLLLSQLHVSMGTSEAMSGTHSVEARDMGGHAVTSWGAAGSEWRDAGGFRPCGPRYR